MKGKFPTMELNSGRETVTFLKSFLAKGGGNSKESPRFTLKISERITLGKFSKLAISCLNKLIVESPAGNFAISKPQIFLRSSLWVTFLEKNFSRSYIRI